MKRILIISAALLASWHVYGQGTVSFVTFGGGVNAKVTFTGTTNGVAGAAFLAQLYYGPAGAPESALTSVIEAPARFLTGTGAGYITATSGGGLRVLQGIPEGGTARIQIRAWEAALGSSYEVAHANWQAMNPGGTYLGNSILLQITTGAPAGSPPTPPALLTGLNPGWSVNQVPEPSVIALAVLGGLGVLLLRRRK